MTKTDFYLQSLNTLDLTARQFRERVNAVTLIEFRFLLAAQAHKDWNIKDLADLRYVDKANTHKLVHRLSNKGVMTVRKNPRDHRQCQVAITPKGKQVISECINALSEILK